MKTQRKAPVIRMRRSDLGHKRTMFLYVQAGGRCEFPGCNKYLLKHSITHTTDNYGAMAHIVAFSEAGPRGRSFRRRKDVHDLSNLMLLCDECHKLIDRHPRDYPISVLRAHKKEHEENVYFSTGIRRSQMTAILRLEAPIDSKPVSIPMVQVDNAIAPRLRAEKPNCHIDLNDLAAIGEKTLMSAAIGTVEARVKDFLARGLVTERVEHVSVFGLAPVPLLVLLGYRLGNTIPTDIYHHHHDTDDWTWKKSIQHTGFEYKLVRKGQVLDCVALLISISGSIDSTRLPRELGAQAYIYQISPRGVNPSTNCLRTRESLENFRRAYEDCLRNLRREHPTLTTIHFFPAVPPPIAILCGRELMPKVDPALRVYDYNKKHGGFEFVLEVNPNDK